MGPTWLWWDHKPWQVAEAGKMGRPQEKGPETPTPEFLEQERVRAGRQRPAEAPGRSER